ncbi:uncharacterized protein PV09_04401 [Verruconis gallopava]|uniref:C2H2-type domain-containing protein n=1 Tax=Verruconis gallopava TaxID=253628 RepID=A0A0D1YVE6_9PEZI|nr:uncharacterized protein PV09_04401 [Verruconis gallopava]KIW04662.1 hypothetical protein PV09_04401 [Verruconis gallopava]
MADDVAVSPATRPTRYQCPQCERSFIRREHLRRHSAIHVATAAFICHKCLKRFTRSDVLTRHEATHFVTSSGRKQKGMRSCKACVVAKSRCSSTLPCSRCIDKMIDCQPQTTPRGHSRPVDEEDAAARRSSAPLLPSGNDSPVSVDYCTPPSTSTVPTSQSTPCQQSQITSVLSTFDVMLESVQQTEDVSMQGNVAGSASMASLSTPNDPLGPSSIASSDVPHLAVSANESGVERVMRSSELYVDSDGARLPRIKRPHATRAGRPPLRTQAKSNNPFCFPISRPLTPELEDESLRFRSFLRQDAWEEMRDRFESYCLTPSAVFPSFSSSHFPNQHDFEVMILGYFDNFHQILPLLHLSTLTLDRSSWLLALGIATIGSHFLQGDSKFRYVDTMHEFLQRALVFAAEHENEPIDTGHVTAKLLHSIGMMFSGDRNCLQKARSWRADLVTAYKMLCSAACRHGSLIATNDEDILTVSSWLEWITVERYCRLAYSIWMIDSMWSYLLKEDAFLPSMLPTIPLPCAEILWDAPSAKQWREIAVIAGTTSSLKNSVKDIFVRREVRSTLGEFSRILLIHGLYHHMRHIKGVLESDLEWSTVGIDHDVSAGMPWWTWPPTLSSYHKWREASCDCLDTLHWRANSVVGAASGLEHPTVAHLHLARIVLLTPYGEIQDFATSLMSQNNEICQRRLELTTIVRTWAQQDCAKARLAIIHAGVTFWHLRRFSVGAFYEAHAVVLAALVLWAFAIFTERQPLQTHSPSTPCTTTTSSKNPLPASINLDRPCDDELVQAFIQEGTRIPAMIGGVGDICSPLGPLRILEQAMDILRTFDNWGIAAEATDFLSRLSQVDYAALMAV